jgi:uncharacterized membrane protein SpoIIM required for sporulation
LERDPGRAMAVDELERLHYLYQRASSALARVSHLASERELTGYLESLVGRAHGEIQEARGDRAKFSLWRWFAASFPAAFRRHAQAFWLTVALTMAGVLFGAVAMYLDADTRHVFLPFGHADVTPGERVANEMKDAGKGISGAQAPFSAHLIQNNTRVSILCMSLGLTYGLGTLVMLFFNGAMLGAIIFDYVAGGQTVFMLGWLLPHGVIEIPAILIAGQAGFVLAHALIGHGSRLRLADRLRQATPDVVHLIGGVAALLVWAGIVEAFFSQYHEPVVPYAVKIAFGVAELILFAAFLAMSGRRAS